MISKGRRRKSWSSDAKTNKICCGRVELIEPTTLWRSMTGRLSHPRLIVPAKYHSIRLTSNRSSCWGPWYPMSRYQSWMMGESLKLGSLCLYRRRRNWWSQRSPRSSRSFSLSCKIKSCSTKCDVPNLSHSLNPEIASPFKTTGQH